jgi:hypothetical protein
LTTSVFLLLRGRSHPPAHGRVHDRRNRVDMSVLPLPRTWRRGRAAVQVTTSPEANAARASPPNSTAGSPTCSPSAPGRRPAVETATCPPSSGGSPSHREEEGDHRRGALDSRDRLAPTWPTTATTRTRGDSRSGASVNTGSWRSGSRPHSTYSSAEHNVGAGSVADPPAHDPPGDASRTITSHSGSRRWGRATGCGRLPPRPSGQVGKPPGTRVPRVVAPQCSTVPSRAMRPTPWAS